MNIPAHHKWCGFWFSSDLHIPEDKVAFARLVTESFIHFNGPWGHLVVHERNTAGVL